MEVEGMALLQVVDLGEVRKGLLMERTENH